MSERQRELETKAQLALNALRRAVDKAYANGTAVDLRTPEEKAQAETKKTA